MSSTTKDAVLLQVRLDSTRLPGKALLALGDLTVVEHAMRSLLLVPAADRILVTDADSASKLQSLAEKWDFELFTGPKEDVLKRFALAIEGRGFDRILRATGDNPLVSASLASQLLELQQLHSWDYCGFLGPPLGTGVEVMRADALRLADKESTDPYEREHVAPFLYHRPERFLIARPQAPVALSLPDMRVTLDTPEDYRYLSRIFRECYTGEPIPVQRLISWYRASEEEGSNGRG
ncbi:cytidylyltransferase domain-containing protein [Sediminispirochaeta smaragdinae]|uniref:Acylneuraminate cytidylyltransferase n=1 Tax=Sediminispirochaeta smaragdinae (strain DSM 11293 / JCM 15392 / SEBR 4228) TaxID=573413 RepID=E1R3R3_SEDSS|nr:acylneuraminate cytidylyltransferase [Sediminispirochaeta smaragdinae]ADK82034.1 acylneuraminate cytidylyltransferase [Sediminispirochaeta smaragdinae DSM 11293]